MDEMRSYLTGALIVGIGATAIMDAWGMVRKPLLGIAPPNYGLVGRWIAHVARGRFHHAAIAATPPVQGERLIGWAFHYLTGIVFAAVLLAAWGPAWIDQPTIAPALVVGIGTVAAPFLLMQPGMGAGFAASRTADPIAARLQSLVTHTVFGIGLYVSGRIFHFFSLA